MKKVTCVMRDATAQHRLKKTTGREKKAIKEKLWKTKVSGSSFFFNNQNLKKLTRFLQKQRWSLRFPATCITSDTGENLQGFECTCGQLTDIKKIQLLSKNRADAPCETKWMAIKRCFGRVQQKRTKLKTQLPAHTGSRLCDTSSNLV